MGVSYSNSLNHFRNEVDTKLLRPLESAVNSQKLLADRPFEERGRKVLFTYPSLLLLGFMDGMSIDLGHLAVLFVLDGDRDGLFSWRDIESFVEWVHTTIPTDEKELGGAFSEAVHARCVLQMWRECIGMHGSQGEGIKPSQGGYGSSEVGSPDGVVSALSTPAHDPLRGGTSSAASYGTRQGAEFGERASAGSRMAEGAESEIFEEWFERFLSRNFPFLSDRHHQQAPIAVGDGPGASTGPNRTTMGNTNHHAIVGGGGGALSSLVVDAAGTDAIAVCEVGPLELRQRPRAFSLDAVAAAHVLLGVEEKHGMDLRAFCSTLVGEKNLLHQGKNFTCSAAALRAFNTAFVDAYWTALSRFGLQELL